MKTELPVLVVASYPADFREYCEEEGLKPGHDAIHLRSYKDVLGRRFSRLVFYKDPRPLPLSTMALAVQAVEEVVL